MGKGIVVCLIILTFLFVQCRDESDAIDGRGCIKGETISFYGQEEAHLYKQNHSPLNILLYSLDSLRNRRIYQENIDYIIGKNGIYRTTFSTLPDRKNHRVNYTAEGKFKWSQKPLHPPSMVPYQVYVDYTYDVSGEPTVFLPPGNIAKYVMSRIAQNRRIKIAIVGTSISHGEDTYQRKNFNSSDDCYWSLIAVALQKVYKIPCLAFDFSVSGSDINSFLTSLDTVISSEPDIVFIEYGMNDHFVDNSESFKKLLENGIQKLQALGIKPFIVGFPQRNELWEKEVSALTLKYNHALREVAEEYNVPFADVYGCFQKIDRQKIRYNYLSDFIHHPTSFGHQLYYLSIMPYLLHREYRESDLFGLLYEEDNLKGEF